MAAPEDLSLADLPDLPQNGGIINPELLTAGGATAIAGILSPIRQAMLSGRAAQMQESDPRFRVWDNRLKGFGKGTVGTILGIVTTGPYGLLAFHKRSADKRCYEEMMNSGLTQEELNSCFDKDSGKDQIFGYDESARELNQKKLDHIWELWKKAKAGNANEDEKLQLKMVGAGDTTIDLEAWMRKPIEVQNTEGQRIRNFLRGIGLYPNANPDVPDIIDDQPSEEEKKQAFFNVLIRLHTATNPIMRHKNIFGSAVNAMFPWNPPILIDSKNWVLEKMESSPFYIGSVVKNVRAGFNYVFGRKGIEQNFFDKHTATKHILDGISLPETDEELYKKNFPKNPVGTRDRTNSDDWTQLEKEGEKKVYRAVLNNRKAKSLIYEKLKDKKKDGENILWEYVPEPNQTGSHQSVHIGDVIAPLDVNLNGQVQNLDKTKPPQKIYFRDNVNIDSLEELVEDKYGLDIFCNKFEASHKDVIMSALKTHAPATQQTPFYSAGRKHVQKRISGHYGTLDKEDITDDLLSIVDVATGIEAIDKHIPGWVNPVIAYFQRESRKKLKEQLKQAQEKKS